MLGIVLGTGPSLAGQIETIKTLQNQGAMVFGVNNTYQDFELDAWIACDPAWHEHYGKVDLPYTDQWHWDADICNAYGYRHIEGVWMVDGQAYPRSEYEHPPGPCGGLWVADNTKLSLNHCSSAQALNLAVHYRCDTILLVGHDFKYEPGKPRHYFDNLSDKAGEYPDRLRKFSQFIKPEGNDLLAVYRRIADQKGLPRIINCSPGSALLWFPRADLEYFISQ